jgi:2-polyprenyl-3-methyl-5-hydroxy-6-metoxy-1,4-benzoquinol methylase
MGEEPEKVVKTESCSICGASATARVVTVRSGKQMTLWHCQPCDFDFFAHDPSSSLAANKLDESRLKAAGLDIPTLERDFANGVAQSRPEIEEYLEPGDRGANVLEIGCSWGYFLKLARDAGAKPYGVELNTLRAGYVNDQLGIPCDVTLDACEARGVRFRKVFLFYVLEYVPDPVAYLQRVVDMLEEGGSLIVVTPNLSDVIKDAWGNEAFRRFFYDEHAINYMSATAVERMVAKLRKRDTSVTTRQGYSFVNHASWFLTNAPRTTGVVGGDNFVRDMHAALAGTGHALGSELSALLRDFDAGYRQAIVRHAYGNQVRFVVRK